MKFDHVGFAFYETQLSECKCSEQQNTAICRVLLR